MKKIVVAVLMVVCLALPAAAVEKEESPVNANISIGAYGAYIDKLSGEILVDNAVIQPSIELSSSSGAYLIAEQYHDSRDDGNRAYETDFYLGIEKEIGHYFIKSIDIGYYFSDTKDYKADFHGPYAVVDLEDIFGIIPYAILEQDISTKEDKIKGGFLYRAGLKYSAASINADISIAGHDGAYGYRPEPISSAKATVSIAFNIRKIEIAPEISYQKRLSDYSYEDGGIIKKDDYVWGGAKISLSF